MSPSHQRLQHDVEGVGCVQPEPDEWEIAAEELLMGPRIGIGSFGEVRKNPSIPALPFVDNRSCHLSSRATEQCVLLS